MEYRGLYVSATPDCEPNEGGYYCQVYADEDYGDQIDDFCIHPDELEENDDIKHWGKVNIDGSYRYYVENGVISPAMGVAPVGRFVTSPRGVKTNTSSANISTLRVWINSSASVFS